jgi:predicted DNA-binding protein
MPTKKPRMILTLEPETKAILDELSEVAGKPASTFISEMLSEAAEAMFRPMIEALRLAKNQKEQAWDVLNHALAKSQHNAAQLSLAIHDEKSKEKAKGRKRAKTK